MNSRSAGALEAKIRVPLRHARIRARSHTGGIVGDIRFLPDPVLCPQARSRARHMWISLRQECPRLTFCSLGLALRLADNGLVFTNRASCAHPIGDIGGGRGLVSAGCARRMGIAVSCTVTTVFPIGAAFARHRARAQQQEQEHLEQTACHRHVRREGGEHNNNNMTFTADILLSTTPRQ